MAFGNALPKDMGYINSVLSVHFTQGFWKWVGHVSVHYRSALGLDCKKNINTLKPVEENPTASLLQIISSQNISLCGVLHIPGIAVQCHHKLIMFSFGHFLQTIRTIRRNISFIIKMIIFRSPCLLEASLEDPSVSVRN